MTPGQCPTQTGVRLSLDSIRNFFLVAETPHRSLLNSPRTKAAPASRVPCHLPSGVTLLFLCGCFRVLRRYGTHTACQSFADLVSLAFCRTEDLPHSTA